MREELEVGELELISSRRGGGSSSLVNHLDILVLRHLICDVSFDLCSQLLRVRSSVHWKKIDDARHLGLLSHLDERLLSRSIEDAVLVDQLLDLVFSLN